MCIQWWIEDLKGMSNFFMYELEANAWDEFGENDDHIVPHAGDELKDQFVIQGNSCKKPRQELHHGRSSSASSYGTQGKDKLYLISQEEKMLEKGSWSCTPEGMFTSCNTDSSKEVKRLSSDDTGMSDHCFKNGNIDSSGSELCADDTILGDKCVVEDDSVCQYPINHISQSDNELSFLDNDGWLDIGNFEDVDRMFRSCDSTFGMGSLNNEEEFCWLSSSHGTEGSDDALKSDFQFSCADASPLKNIPEYNIDVKPTIEDPPINDSIKKASPTDKKLRSLMDVDDDTAPDPLSMLSESDMKSGNTDDSRPKDKRKLSKLSEGRTKIDRLENGDSVYPFAPPNHYGDVKQLYEASSSGITSQASIQKHKANTDLGCIRAKIPLVNPDYCNAPNHPSLLPTLSGSGSEHNGPPSSSLKESSYASNMNISHGHPLQTASLKANDEGEKLYHSHDALLLSRSFKDEKMASAAPFNNPDSARQQFHQLENENEGHSVVGGVSIGFSQEIDSENVQESPTMSSALEEISPEATSFCQLQQVMGQLDIRTKMCIRDSLYRLAKSAEQRHNYANTNGSVGDDVEECKAMEQDTSRCTGFVDMETNTNPIDRSIAHLLFHRPSDPSVLSLDDTIPFKSDVMINGSVTNLPVGTEKQVCQEEASYGVERKPLGG